MIVERGGCITVSYDNDVDVLRVTIFLCFRFRAWKCNVLCNITPSSCCERRPFLRCDFEFIVIFRDFLATPSLFDSLDQNMIIVISSFAFRVSHTGVTQQSFFPRWSEQLLPHSCCSLSFCQTNVIICENELLTRCCCFGRYDGFCHCVGSILRCRTDQEGCSLRWYRRKFQIWRYESFAVFVYFVQLVAHRELFFLLTMIESVRWITSL